jgi:hypothetical protein
MSVSLSFIHDICERFIFELSHDGGIEFTRRPRPLDDDKIAEISRNAPFMTGAEFVDGDRIEMFWAGLSEAFAAEMNKWEGTAEEFFDRSQHPPERGRKGIFPSCRE